MNIKDLPQGSFQVEQPETLNINNLPKGSYTLDHSMAGLGRSQYLSDLAQQTKQAKEEADALASPIGIAKETAKGAVGTLFDKTLKVAQSVVHAPSDIYNKLSGGSVDTSMKPNFSQTGQRTIQGDLASGGSFGRAALDVAEGTPIPASFTAKGVSLLKRTTLKPVNSLVKGVMEKTGVSKFLAERADRKATQAAIDAVYVSPTGRKFTQTSKQVLTGEREVVPAAMFREQGLTPDERTVNLGTRLKDIGLSKNPVKNTELLANDFTKTETALQQALKPADPSVVYTADKQTLFEKLQQVRDASPQEFRIRDSNLMIKRVTDFANKVVNESDDTIWGIREARKSFDIQARREFPTAWKPDGSIDTRTPAGYAIKETRDSINAHLYDAAPNGSEIQRLIGREADLYNAIQAAMQKAGTTEGKTQIRQIIDKYPYLALAFGLATLGYGNKKLEETTGISLPLPSFQ